MTASSPMMQNINTMRLDGNIAAVPILNTFEDREGDPEDEYFRRVRFLGRVLSFLPCSGAHAEYVLPLTLD